MTDDGFALGARRPEFAPPRLCNQGHKLVRNALHDAYACQQCDTWNEPTCNASDCGFCVDRPERPSLTG